MPLYKVTEKKLAKRKREDEDGTTELKAALGIDQAAEDSDTSGSDSGSDSGSESDSGFDEDEDNAEASGSGTSSYDSEDEEEEVDEEDVEEEENEEEESSDEEDDELDGLPPMSVDEVATGPVYELDTPAGSFGCVVCPTKVFKNEHMADVHQKSGSHQRAMKRWNSKISEYEKNGEDVSAEDPRLIVAEITRNIEQRRTGDKVDGSHAQQITPAQIRAGKRKERKEAGRPAKKERKLAKESKKQQSKDDPSAANGAPGPKHKREKVGLVTEISRKKASPRSIRKKEKLAKLEAAMLAGGGGDRKVVTGGNRQMRRLQQRLQAQGKDS